MREHHFHKKKLSEAIKFAFAGPAALMVIAKLNSKLDLTSIIEVIILNISDFSFKIWVKIIYLFGLNIDLVEYHNLLSFTVMIIIPSISGYIKTTKKSYLIHYANNKALPSEVGRMFFYRKFGEFLYYHMLWNRAEKSLFFKKNKLELLLHKIKYELRIGITHQFGVKFEAIIVAFFIAYISYEFKLFDRLNLTELTYGLIIIIFGSISILIKRICQNSADIKLDNEIDTNNHAFDYLKERLSFLFYTLSLIGLVIYLLTASKPWIFIDKEYSFNNEIFHFGNIILIAIYFVIFVSFVIFSKRTFYYTALWFMGILSINWISVDMIPSINKFLNQRLDTFIY